MILMTILSYMSEHKELVAKGLFSVLFMAIGWIQGLEMWLRMGSLIVGLVLGIATAIKVILDIRIKYRELKKNK